MLAYTEVCSLNNLGEVLRRKIELVKSHFYYSKSNPQYLYDASCKAVSYSSGNARALPGFEKTCVGAALLGTRAETGKLAKSFGTASDASVAEAIAAIVWGRRGDARLTEQTRCSTNGSLGAVRDWQRSGAERPDNVTPFARHALPREGGAWIGRATRP